MRKKPLLAIWGAALWLLLSLMGLTSSALPVAARTEAVAQAPRATASAPADLIDINSATKGQLDALPGIGKTYSQKIIDGRPYKTKTDLVRRNILPQSTYNKISKLIIARQPAK
jgi:competence protein ComEA